MALPQDGAFLPPAPTAMHGVGLDIRTLIVGGKFDEQTTTMTGVFLRVMTDPALDIPVVPVIAVFEQAGQVDRLIDLLQKHRENVWGKR